MISLLLSLSFGQIMWGERAQKTCFNYAPETGALKQLAVRQCSGVELYYRKIGDQVRPGRVASARVVGGGPFPWKHCRNSKWSTSPFDKKGLFRPECAPDTLYSWQPCSRVVRMKKSWEKGERSLGKRFFMYTWRTPMGSNSFGACGIRIKLKPGVKFVNTRSSRRTCQRHQEAMDGKAVIVSYTSKWHEYIICNSDVIESWSYGLPKHVLEMKRETATIETQDHENFDRFRGDSGGKTCSLKRGVPNMVKKIENVSGVLERLKLGDGVVFPRELAGRHFQSKYKSYFNPRGR